MDAGKNRALLDAHTLQELRQLFATVEAMRTDMASMIKTMENATPAVRALAVLLRKIPAAGDMPAREGLALVRDIAHEFQRMHGARGGKRRAARSMEKARRCQVTWEDACARKLSTGAATAQTAQAHGITPGQVRRLLREARKRGTPWNGDDES